MTIDTNIIEEIEYTVNPALYPVIRRLYCIDPHDLITPETHFDGLSHAMGFVLNLMLETADEMGIQFRQRRDSATGEMVNV